MIKMIKILFIISGLEVGGAETMLFRIATQLNKKEFFPVVCSLTTKGKIGEQLEKEGIKVYALACKGILDTRKAIKKIKEIVKKENPDIINSFMMHANLIARFCRIKEQENKSRKLVEE